MVELDKDLGSGIVDLTGWPLDRLALLDETILESVVHSLRRQGDESLCLWNSDGVPRAGGNSA